LITTGLSIDDDDSGTVYFGLTSKYESLVPDLAGSTKSKAQSSVVGKQTTLSFRYYKEAPL